MKRLFDTENMNPQEYNGMKVGDVICTHNAGYHVLLNINRRFCTQDSYDRHYKDMPLDRPHRLEVGDEYSPSFVYVKVDPATGKLGRHGECDSHYCKPGIQSLEDQITILQKQRNKLKELNFVLTCPGLAREGASCSHNNLCTYPRCLRVKRV